MLFLPEILTKSFLADLIFFFYFGSLYCTVLSTFMSVSSRKNHRESLLYVLGEKADSRHDYYLKSVEWEIHDERFIILEQLL